MTDPATAIRREVRPLVEAQIQTLRQESSLTPSELLDYRARSKQITKLYQDLDQIARIGLGFASVRAD
jgi:hypothetical protein